MLLVKTPAFRSWYLYKIAAYFSSLLSLQSLCLHSNAKTPSSVILSQHIATFFFGRLSSIVSTPHTSALIQSLSAEMGKYNFLQKKVLTVMILEWQDFLSERNSVVLQCIRFYRWSRVIQCICVMSRLSSKRTGIRQCSSTTVTEKPTKKQNSLVFLFTCIANIALRTFLKRTYHA